MWKTTYQIINEYKDLISLLEEDEVTDELVETLTINRSEMENKITDYLTILTVQDDENKRIDNEIQKLKRRKEVNDKSAERIKEQIKLAVNLYGIDNKSNNKQIKYENVSLTITKSKSLKVDDVWNIPSEYLFFDVKLNAELYYKLGKEVSGKVNVDKVKLKKYIEEGNKVEDVEIIENENLVIK